MLPSQLWSRYPAAQVHHAGWQRGGGVRPAFGRPGAVASEDTMGKRNGILSIAAAGLLCAMAAGAPAQEKSRYPDWSGHWSRVPDGDVPRYDPTKPIRKQEAPLKPEYQARLEASIRGSGPRRRGPRHGLQLST